MMEEEKNTHTDKGDGGASRPKKKIGMNEVEFEVTSLDKDNSPFPTNSLPFEIITKAEEINSEHSEVEAKILLKQLSSLENKIDQLSVEFQSKLKYDKHRESIIDNLHAELQQHKNGLMEKLLRPIFMDIIELIDDNRSLVKDMALNNEDENPKKLKRFFGAVSEDLEDLLYKHGVEAMEVMTNNVFNPSVQRVIKTINTEEKQLDKRVAEKLKSGYKWEGRLLRHQIVSVWQFK